MGTGESLYQEYEQWHEEKADSLTDEGVKTARASLQSHCILFLSKLSNSDDC